MYITNIQQDGPNTVLHVPLDFATVSKAEAVQHFLEVEAIGRGKFSTKKLEKLHSELKGYWVLSNKPKEACQLRKGVHASSLCSRICTIVTTFVTDGFYSGSGPAKLLEALSIRWVVVSCHHYITCQPHLWRMFLMLNLSMVYPAWTGNYICKI